MEAEGKANAARIAGVVAAEVTKIKAEGDSSATRLKAAAELDAARAAADAVAYAGQKAADAERFVLDARAAGMLELIKSFGGDASAVVAYLALEKGTWGQLAEAQAKALHGLNPRISVWASDGKTAMNPLRQLGGSLPPLFEALAQQTGLDVPALLQLIAPPAAAPCSRRGRRRGPSSSSKRSPSRLRPRTVSPA